MINLDTTTALLRVVTTGTADIDVGVHFVEHDYTTAGAANEIMREGMQPTKINTATTTTILGSPASATIDRNAVTITIVNIHASAANTVTIEHTNGTTATRIDKVTLAAGEKWEMNAQGTIFVYDANGGVKMGASAASDTLAGLIMIGSVAEMEAGTDVAKAVTPGRFHRHPASPKAWLSCDAAGNLQQSYNITSLTDTGTGVVTITIATDFAAATFAVIGQVEATGTTWAVANSRECHVRSATRAVGSVALDCIDNTVTTNLVKDPTTWHAVMFGDHA